MRFYFTGGAEVRQEPGGIELWADVVPTLGPHGVRQAGEFTIKPRIAWGQSIIVPSDSQVAGEESEFSILLANPDLRAQKQRGYDLGVDFLYRDKGSIGLTFFDQDPIDLIELVITGSDLSGPFPPRSPVPESASRQHRGWEVKIEAQPVPQLALNVNYGSTKSTVLELDESYVGDYEVGETLKERPFGRLRWVPA